MIAQPIETAPKDGTNILLYFPQWKKEWRWVLGWWEDTVETRNGTVTRDDHGWRLEAGYQKDPQPTHWAPLPEDPA